MCPFDVSHPPRLVSGSNFLLRKLYRPNEIKSRIDEALMMELRLAVEDMKMLDIDTILRR